jgi:hypothetical protein
LAGGYSHCDEKIEWHSLKVLQIFVAESCKLDKPVGLCKSGHSLVTILPVDAWETVGRWRQISKISELALEESGNLDCME